MLYTVCAPHIYPKKYEPLSSTVYLLYGTLINFTTLFAQRSNEINVVFQSAHHFKVYVKNKANIDNVFKLILIYRTIFFSIGLASSGVHKGAGQGAMELFYGLVESEL